MSDETSDSIYAYAAKRLRAVERMLASLEETVKSLKAEEGDLRALVKGDPHGSEEPRVQPPTLRQQIIEVLAAGPRAAVAVRDLLEERHGRKTTLKTVSSLLSKMKHGKAVVALGEGLWALPRFAAGADR